MAYSRGMHIDSNRICCNVYKTRSGQGRQLKNRLDTYRAKKAIYLGLRAVAPQFRNATGNGPAGDSAVQSDGSQAGNNTPSKSAAKKHLSDNGQTEYNVIVGSKWPGGVPASMGGHFMPSGEVSPVTRSKGKLEENGAEPVDRHIHPFHYYEDGLPVEKSKVLVHSTKQELAKGLISDVEAVAKESIAKRGFFTIALSGGSLLNLLEGLKSVNGVDWGKVHVFWVDERHVPLDNADSNAGTANRLFLNELGISDSQLHVIDASLTVVQSARAYEGRMLNLPLEVLPRSENGLPVLDMVLLGVGPDGHVASLFPNRPEIADSSSWILPIENSPKPPSERITMSLDVLNAASNVCVVASGSGKAEIVQRVLEVQSLPGALPAQLIHPSDGILTWYLDKDSASDIRPSAWGDKKVFPRNQV